MLVGILAALCTAAIFIGAAIACTIGCAEHGRLTDTHAAGMEKDEQHGRVLIRMPQALQSGNVEIGAQCQTQTHANIFMHGLKNVIIAIVIVVIIHCVVGTKSFVAPGERPRTAPSRPMLAQAHFGKRLPAINAHDRRQVNHRLKRIIQPLQRGRMRWHPACCRRRPWRSIGRRRQRCAAARIHGHCRGDGRRLLAGKLRLEQQRVWQRCDSAAIVPTLASSGGAAFRLPQPLAGERAQRRTRAAIAASVDQACTQRTRRSLHALASRQRRTRGGDGASRARIHGEVGLREAGRQGQRQRGVGRPNHAQPRAAARG